MRNRNEERRVCTFLLHVFRTSPKPIENRLTAILNWKKPYKSVPGFEPSLPRKNAITLPLVPYKQALAEIPQKQAEVLFEVFPQLLPFTRSRLQVEKIKCSKFENLLNDVELLLELHPRWSRWPRCTFCALPKSRSIAADPPPTWSWGTRRSRTRRRQIWARPEKQDNKKRLTTREKNCNQTVAQKQDGSKESH